MKASLKPNMPSRLHIWQQNARKSQVAQHYILNINPCLYNLILLQEPWIDSFGNARGNHHWRIIYPANRFIDGHSTIRSIILINSNISTDSYTALSIPHSNISTLHLSGNFGTCSVFNIYNDCNNNNTIKALKLYLNTNPNEALPSPTDHMLWCSDFNRHHPLWEEDTNHRLFNGEEMINPLLDLLSEHDMVLSLPQGIPTYEMANGNWTRPDNVWRSNNPIDLIVSCNFKPSLCSPCTDHLPIIINLNLTLVRANPLPMCNL